jgi:acyl-coenzyme A synthetase/AMP-(fatty) acid ligase
MTSSLELLGAHRMDACVAFGGAGPKTASELLADAAHVSRALPPASDQSHVLLVFERDRYQMAAALLGALDRGHAVALPPTLRREAIWSVRQRPETVAMVHDTDAGIDFRVSDLIDRAPAGPPLTAPIVPGRRVMATVFTSGTTGPMTAWRKTAAELLGEAHSLGATFRIDAGDRIVGTVPPGHIYGLLFTILLPLARGAAFSRETPHHAESIAHCANAHRASVLVTVPAHLRALSALEAGALSNLRRVFSSTGPLPEPVVRAFAKRHGLPVTEVLGSTETGGIAWRERRGGEASSWRPFASVRVAVGPGGRLRVDSPFVHADLPRPFETADLVRMNEDGSFEHLGRADGIVKIGGHRVSIQEVEGCIRQQPGVEDVAIVAIPAEGARGHQLLAAVAPASVDLANLKAALLKRFEPTCLPRRIVRIDELPVESNGKTQRERILRLFGLKPNGQPFDWTVEWDEPKAESRGPRESISFGVRLPEDYGWFEGHFDGFPVLAGAVQLKELVFPAIARAFPDLGDVIAMPRIKFPGRITRGDSLTVRIERGVRAGRVSFEIRNGEQVRTYGTLILSQEKEGPHEDQVRGEAR